jgi:hypothetical protein
MDLFDLIESLDHEVTTLFQQIYYLARFGMRDERRGMGDACGNASQRGMRDACGNALQRQMGDGG